MGVDKINLTPFVSPVSHHGQSDGTGHPWNFRFHWGNESIDEVVPMGATAYWALTDAYRADDQTAFATAFNPWLLANGSTALFAKLAQARAGFWYYLNGLKQVP